MTSTLLNINVKELKFYNVDCKLKFCEKDSFDKEKFIVKKREYSKMIFLYPSARFHHLLEGSTYLWHKLLFILVFPRSTLSFPRWALSADDILLNFSLFPIAVNI